MKGSELMQKLNVSVELNGEMHSVGYIEGKDYADAEFSYSKDFLSISGKPISISLPFQKEPFSPQATKNFFEGLLPEGFYRKTIASSIKADENDYLSILKALGQECIGAIRITEDNDNATLDEYVRLSRQEVKQLAEEGISKATDVLMRTHLSLTGASGKVGLYLDEIENAWYLPKGCAASTHIVKQSHIRLNQIVLNEQLCLLTAKNIGIDIPESFIMNLGDKNVEENNDKDFLFATKRFDRKLSEDKQLNNLSIPLRLHQEDFAQALGIAACDKYERAPAGYLGRIFKLIRDYSTDPIGDQKKLWDRIIFNYIIGNTDGHIKNFSLLYSSGMESVRIAPAYDIICTTLYGMSREMAFALGDEINIDKINRESIMKAAKEAKLGEKFAMNEVEIMLENFDNAMNLAAEELINAGFDEAEIMKERILKDRKKSLRL